MRVEIVPIALGQGVTVRQDWPLLIDYWWLRWPEGDRIITLQYWITRFTKSARILVDDARTPTVWWRASSNAGRNPLLLDDEVWIVSMNLDTVRYLSRMKTRRFKTK